MAQIERFERIADNSTSALANRAMLRAAVLSRAYASSIAIRCGSEGCPMSEQLWLPTRALMGLIEATNDAVLITTAQDLDAPGPRIRYANPAFLKMTGYELGEVTGKSPRILQGPGTDAAALGRIRRALNDARPCREEVLNYSKRGKPYWIDIHIVPLFGDDGALQYFGAIQRDVTAQRRKMDRLERLAHEDALTGIGNRAALQRHLDTLAARPGREEGSLHCVLIDLDGFKVVNDTFGHQAGDRLLRLYAAFIVSGLRRDDFVSRLGGDEFAIMLDGYSRSDAMRLADRFAAVPKAITGDEFGPIFASVGIVTFVPGDGLESVLSRADEALYAAKRAGKGIVRMAG